MRNNLKYIILLILIILITFFVLYLKYKSKPLINNEIKDDNLNIVLFAIGDSLTEGVGDESLNGGYVPILGEYLNNEYKPTTIEVYNNGKSGDKTFQVLNRIEESKEIQNELKNATIITVTIGGNDLIAIVKDYIFDATAVNKVENSKDEYIKNLQNLYNTIRKYNTNSPIYHLGIYNPFYLYFQDNIQMQYMVDFWNTTTNDFIKNQNNAFFVPINDKIYEGTGVKNENDLLSQEDYFHPNYQGYQIIANAFKEKIVSTSE